MKEITEGKLNFRDARVAYLLKWVPWLSFFLVSLPLPLIFFILFVATAATDSAAIYLLLTLTSMGLGAVLGLMVVIFLLLYRRRWYGKLRDKLAADGITATEVAWFMPELSTTERAALREIQKQNPLLADAYRETLAARLTATRLVKVVSRERLKTERRINQARSLTDADTTSLLSDLEADLSQMGKLAEEARARLADAKAQLQMIEAAASRTLNQVETDRMRRRLSAAQQNLPLVIEMQKLEREAVREAEMQVNQTQLRSDTTETDHSP